MDKNLITFDELKDFVKSVGKTKNKKIDIFLNEVFKIGFGNNVDDIFPMSDFAYGDFLREDNDFIYELYLIFLKSNEDIDNVLFHFAECDYKRFLEVCAIHFDLKAKYDVKKLVNEQDKEIQTLMAANEKILTEEEKLKAKIPKDLLNLINTEQEHEKLNELIKNDIVNGNVDLSSSDFLLFFKTITKKRVEDELREVGRDSNIISYEEKKLKFEDQNIFDLAQSKLGIIVTNEIAQNMYARIRIKEYAKDLATISEHIGDVFKK